VLLACAALAGCSAGAPSTVVTATPGPTPAAGTAGPDAGTAQSLTRTGAGTPAPTRIGSATPAPSWLGTRVLPTGANGFAQAQDTPRQLRDRSLITVDELPPPADGRFHASVSAVPASVLARSTWTSACPVTVAQLRYVKVSFRGFDGRAHTGELLVNRLVAARLVEVFRRLFAAGFPIERMHITSVAERDAPPTGDGNTTSAFVCRPVRAWTTWSQHAYGMAVDLDPFQNPYHKGQVVLPELATSYLDRSDRRPGMVLPGGAAVRAFVAAGWHWGGDYHSVKDYMHFSATGQ
jgi:hypothetical protein